MITSALTLMQRVASIQVSTSAGSSTITSRRSSKRSSSDHLFTDTVTATGVTACNVIDNSDVRHLSDHGPLVLTIDEELLSPAAL